MKIGWILSGNRHVAGARLQGFLMHEEFVRRGLDSTLLHYPEDYDTDIPFDARQADRWVVEGYTCIVFQKVFSAKAQELARQLRHQGVRTIYIACNLQGEEMADACDATIVVSTFLKAAFGHRRRHCMTVIEDPIEVPTAVAKTSYATSGTLLELLHVAGEPPGAYGLQLVLAAGKQTRLTEISAPQKPQGPDDVDLTPRANRTFTRIVQGAGRLIGTGNPYDLVRKLRWKWYRRIEARRIRAAANIDWGERVRHIDWTPEAVWARLPEADVGVIPCELEHEWSLAKSGNRLLMFMAAGLPVVVSPLPAYVTLMTEAGAESWLVAQTPDDWRQALIRLEDQQVREAIGQNFQRFAKTHYSMEQVASRYLQVFQSDQA